MADRVHPSAKPNATTTTNPTTTTTKPLQFPPAKSQTYNPNRIPYRPTPTAYHRHNRKHCSCRRCFCYCCFWSLLIISTILILAAISGACFYLLFRPKPPLFSVSSVKIAQFKLRTSSDDTTRLTAKVNITLSTKNPNKKLIYNYDALSFTVVSNSVVLANGSFTGFNNGPNNVTIIHSTLSMASQVLDADSVSSLKSDMKRKNGLPLKILLDTMVVAKMDKLKSKKVGIRVTCEGIHGKIPTGKTPVVASIKNAKCKVDLRMKILKWTL
ncbi:NDR1/HIN1-like protein 6 [Lycium barbarum]|uniref:NDR1/HIN1-like protein 6 n=1 Tax=Lycium barbarum TaxID=112863 RepID=UPI00293EF40F|nr:NDR1/HIN1-like protein 6 [Lycium barbarum]